MWHPHFLPSFLIVLWAPVTLQSLRRGSQVVLLKGNHTEPIANQDQFKEPCKHFC